MAGPVRDHGVIHQTIEDILNAINGEAGAGIAGAALAGQNIVANSVSVGPYRSILPGVPGAAIAVPSGFSVGALQDNGGEKWNVKNWGAVGDGTSHPLSGYYSSLANAQVDFPFATALTQTIDWAAGEAASRKASAAGSGGVYFPAGHYIATGATDSILVRSFVTYYGDGYESYLDFTSNVFEADGMDPNAGGYGAYTWRLANAANVGDSTITLQTAAQAADFTVGQLAVLRSVQEDVAYFPAFMEFVKIIGVNVGTGVLTLEDPLEDALADPEIGANPFTTPLVQNASWRDLRMKSAGVYQPLHFSGIYKSFGHHLWLEGGGLFRWNGATKTIFSDIIATAHISASGVATVLEMKSGSYRPTFRDLKVIVVNDDATTNVIPLVWIGERSRSVTVEGGEFLAPNVTVDVINSSSAVRGRYQDLDVVAKNMRYGAYLAGAASASHLIDTNNYVRALRARVSGTWSTGVVITGGGGGTDSQNDEAIDVEIVGTQGTVAGSAPQSVVFNGQNSHVRDSVIPGLYSSAIAGSHLWNSITGGPNSVATRTNVIEHDCLATGALAVPVPAQLFNSLIASTTPGNVAATLTMPSGYPWRVGDKVRFRVAGDFNGTNNTKNVVIADMNGALITLTVAAGVALSFVVEGEAVVVTVTSTVNWRCTGYSVVGGVTATYNPLSSSTTVPVAIPIYIEAWVANAADSVGISQAELQFSRVQDSLSAGATNART
jgi:hypothetical protein